MWHLDLVYVMFQLLGKMFGPVTQAWHLKKMVVP